MQMTVTRKKMATTIKRSVTSASLTRAAGRERLTDSVTGSLRVEGYAVKRDAVSEAVNKHRK